MSLLTPKEVAGQLRIGLSTVYELFHRQQLLGFRVGRKVLIRAESVEAIQNGVPAELHKPCPHPAGESVRPARKSGGRPQKAVGRVRGRLDRGLPLPRKV